MKARVDYRHQRPTAVAIALPYPAAFEVTPMRERLSIWRDTLVVLSMQVAFRTVMFFRHLNY
jgi:hypothetical protein